MTAALLRRWTVPRLNSHSNPSSTGESSTAKKVCLCVPLLLSKWHCLTGEVQQVLDLLLKVAEMTAFLMFFVQW